MENRAARGRGALLSSCVLLLAQGCSKAADGPSQSAATTTSAVTERPADPTSKPEKPGGADTGPVVATGTTSAGSTPLKIELHELRRNNGVVSLNFSVTNTGVAGDAGDDRWQVTEFFDDGTTNGAAAGDGANGDTVDGVYPIDGVNKKRYTVARDTTTHCACSGDMSSTFIGRGQTQTFSATFGAPPPDVRAVDVAIPHSATFANVPLR